MNHRSKARRLAAVRFPLAIVTTLAPGRATAQPIPTKGNYDYDYDYASRSSDTSIGLPFSETHGTNTSGLAVRASNRPISRSAQCRATAWAKAALSTASQAIRMTAKSPTRMATSPCFVSCEKDQKWKNVIEKNEINPVFAANAACRIPLNL